MGLIVTIYHWRWEVIEQLLRWGIYEQEGKGWLKVQLRKVVLKIGLAL